MDTEDKAIAELAHRFGCVFRSFVLTEWGEALSLRCVTGCRPIPNDLLVEGNQQAAYRRFLVARKWVVADSLVLLREIVDWRANFGVDKLLVRICTDAQAFVPYAEKIKIKWKNDDNFFDNTCTMSSRFLFACDRSS